MGSDPGDGGTATGADGGGPADPQEIADLGVLFTAQTAAQQAWTAAVEVGDAASSVAAREEYFRRAEVLARDSPDRRSRAAVGLGCCSRRSSS